MTSSMPRVLIASDIRDWVVNVAEGYRGLGFDVTMGIGNFELEACRPDIVHLQWPEELVGWKVPTSAQIDHVARRLDRWAQRSRLIISVHNLYPHGHYGDPAYHRLFTTCYERAEIIHHFSQTSKDAVCREFPSVRNRNHFVRVGFNYDLLLPAVGRDRNASRQRFGIQQDEITYLVF